MNTSARRVISTGRSFLRAEAVAKSKSTQAVRQTTAAARCLLVGAECGCRRGEQKRPRRHRASARALVVRGAVARPRRSALAARCSHANRSPRPLTALRLPFGWTSSIYLRSFLAPVPFAGLAAVVAASPANAPSSLCGRPSLVSSVRSFLVSLRRVWAGRALPAPSAILKGDAHPRLRLDRF